MSSFQIEFDYYDHGFCESKIFGGHPEFLNSISSLIMSCIAVREIIKINSSLNKYENLYTTHF